MPYEAVKWRPDTNPIDREDAMLAKQMAVAKLIRVHRVRGHLIADLDPLRWKEPMTPRELDPATYGLTIWDLDREFLTDGVGGVDKMRLGDLLGVLRDAYCRTIGVEYMHIQDTDEQQWIQEKFEGVQPEVSKERKHRILERLNAAESFEKFLATKYVGTKRFGIEGAESAIPILDEILSNAADAEFDGAVLGMAHRGRLNVLSNIMGKSYEAIFSEFEGHVDPTSVQGSGDVKYHLGMKGKYVSPSGADVAIELAANPSHLETVGPIVMGMVRALQDQIEPPGAFSVLPVLIHGDAAFAGQGIVAESLAMSDIGGYRIGGTIHLIINNQIGFTTAPQYARSSLYCSDVAKTIQAPIFHVNGDDPEACVHVAELAWEYRQRFHKDVVIDMVCYRRYGHNEGDDPSYTQPLMYKAIAERRSVRKLYVESLVQRGDITVDEAEQALADFQDKLQVALDETRSQAPPTITVPKPPRPLGVLPHIPTGVERPVLDRIFARLTEYPEGFTIHPKLGRQFEGRAATYAEGEVDWATAEALAVGSLVLEGHPVRLAGQDSRRGTFSQRHAALIDFETGEPWIPLDDLGADAKFWVFDSLLSEYAALGFEYGYAQANRDALVMWEAQFGDFINGAQIVIDQYIVAAEDKWGQQNGVGAPAAARLRGAGSRAQLGAHRAVPDPRRRGQHADRQHHDRGELLPPPAPPGALRASHAAHRVHAQAGSAHEADPLTDRRSHVGFVPGDPRRPGRHRCRRGAPDRVLLGQGRVGRDRRTGQARRTGRRRPGRAALPVADRADARDPREVPQRPRAPLAPGGAREHGRLELRRAQHLADQGAGLRPAARRPRRVGQPGDRLQDDPRPGTRRPHASSLRRPLTTFLR